MNFKGKEYKLSVILPWTAKVVRHYKLKMCVNIVLGWVIVGLNFLFVWTTNAGCCFFRAHCLWA